MSTMTSQPSKIVTGMCHAGWHEGTRAKDFKGRPVQVCLLWQECPCECHEKITKMFEIGEQPREVVENPEYVRAERTWYMPVYGVDYGIESSRSVAEPVALDGEVNRPEPIPVPAHARTYAPTPTGRAAKGQLETQVLEVVTEWLIEHDELCTPKFVSTEIARVQHIDEPSVGAIGAVFDRWVKYGYAIVTRSPVQFTGLTDEGSTRGLDALKIQYKRKK